MGLTRDTVVNYAHTIPGIAARDCLFAALHRGHDSRAVERCDLLLSEFSSLPYMGVKQRKMLQRLLTMIRLLQIEEAQQAGVTAAP